MTYWAPVVTRTFSFITGMLIFAMLALHPDRTLDHEWNTIKYHSCSFQHLFLRFFKIDFLLVNRVNWKNETGILILKYT
jgi:hypothetical protein